jgi:hypothetical protein
MNENAIIISGLPILSIISGMLGLGVAFAVGSFTGARVTSLYMPSARIKQLFAILNLLSLRSTSYIRYLGKDTRTLAWKVIL